MNEKMQFAIIVIACMTVLQLVAWVVGANGTVFAFTSLIIGLTAGSILGFSVHKKG